MFDVQILTKRVTIKHHSWKSLSKVIVSFSTEVWTMSVNTFSIACPSVSRTHRLALFKKRFGIAGSCSLVEVRSRHTLNNSQNSLVVHRSEDTKSCDYLKETSTRLGNRWCWSSTFTCQCRHLYRVPRTSIRWRALDGHAPFLLIGPHHDQTDVVRMFSGYGVHVRNKDSCQSELSVSTVSVLSMISLVWRAYWSKT